MSPKPRRWKHPPPTEGLYRDGPRGPIFIEPAPTDAQLTEWVERIRGDERSDDVDALARNVLETIVFRHRTGAHQDSRSIDWLVDCLDAILAGAAPLDVLALLPRKSERPADASPAFNVLMWVTAAEARGYSRAQATELAADAFSKDVSTIRRFLRNSAAAFDLRWAEWYFEAMGRPLPAKMTGKK